MDKQEMFNRAWNGLKSQGFERSMMGGTRCSYADAQGRRCAWGWVDLGLDSHVLSGVDGLYGERIGAAATLSHDELELAKALQRAHDNGVGPKCMEANMREVAEKYNLTIPE